jgi:hypothetical protein
MYTVERQLYESLLGKRVSDSHWSKLKKTAQEAGILLDSQGVRLLIRIKKLSPRFLKNLKQFQSQVQEVSINLGQVVTGKEIERIVFEVMQLNPARSTFLRWFHKLSLPFEQSNHYSRDISGLIMLSALIYKLGRKKR